MGWKKGLWGLAKGSNSQEAEQLLLWGTSVQLYRQGPLTVNKIARDHYFKHCELANGKYLAEQMTGFDS